MHSPSNNLKHTDSRRWSPSRQTWLENALKKTSPANAPGGYDASHSHHNRIPVPSSPVLSRSVKNDPVIAEKPVFLNRQKSNLESWKVPNQSLLCWIPKNIFDKAKNTDTQDNKDDNDLKIDTKKPTSSFQNFETNSTKPTIPAKKVSLGRSATSVTRNKVFHLLYPKSLTLEQTFQLNPVFQQILWLNYKISAHVLQWQFLIKKILLVGTSLCCNVQVPLQFWIMIQ